MMRFRLVIISDYAEKIIEILNDFLRKIFLYSSVSHIIYKDPPKEYYDHFRRQYRADLMLTWLAGFKEDLDEITVGVLDYDGYVPGLNFIFGVADPYLKTASVYTLRLYRGYDRKIDEIFIERLKKEVLHEIDDPSPPLRAGFRISGSRVLALWRGINGFTPLCVIR